MLTPEEQMQIIKAAWARKYEGPVHELIDQAIIERAATAQTDFQKEQGLKGSDGNTSMVFPQSSGDFNTVGMDFPIDVTKYDNQGNLVRSYTKVPPGVKNLSMGNEEGTVIETPSQYQKGGERGGLPSSRTSIAKVDNLAYKQLRKTPIRDFYQWETKTQGGILDESDVDAKTQAYAKTALPETVAKQYTDLGKDIGVYKTGGRYIKPNTKRKQTGGEDDDVAATVDIPEVNVSPKYQVKVIQYPYGYEGGDRGGSPSMQSGHLEAYVVNPEGLPEEWQGGDHKTYINRWVNTGNEPIEYRPQDHESGKTDYEDGVRTVILELNKDQINHFMTTAQSFEEGKEFYLPDGSNIPTQFGQGEKEEYDFLTSNCADGVCWGLGLDDDTKGFNIAGVTDPTRVMDHLLTLDNAHKQTGFRKDIDDESIDFFGYDILRELAPVIARDGTLTKKQTRNLLNNYATDIPKPIRRGLTKYLTEVKASDVMGWLMDNGGNIQGAIDKWKKGSKGDILTKGVAINMIWDDLNISDLTPNLSKGNLVKTLANETLKEYTPFDFDQIPDEYEDSNFLMKGLIGYYNTKKSVDDYWEDKSITDIRNPFKLQNWRNIPGYFGYEKGGFKKQTGGEYTHIPTDSLLVRQQFNESRFKSDAVSPAGAISIAQVTENTFNDGLKKGYVPKGTKYKDLATNDNLAEQFQRNYMKDLQTRSWNKKGTPKVRRAKALAAYNMGPTGLVRHLNAQKKKKVDIYNTLDWVDDLNTETKNYVNNVMLGGDEKYEGEFNTEYEKKFKKQYGGFTPDVYSQDTIVANQIPPADYTPTTKKRKKSKWSLSKIGHGILDVAGAIPGIGEGADLLNAAWYASEGDKVNAALSTAAAVPFLGWGALATKAGLKVKKAKKAKQTWSKGVTHYGKSSQGINNALTGMKGQGKWLDAQGYDASKQLIGKNVINHGNHHGRQIVEVALPNGKTQLFYKSSGLAGKKGAGKGGGTGGLWQPYGGHASTSRTDNWFIKDAGYKDYYGSKSFRDIAGNLDRIAVEQGWDMSGQVIKQKGGVRGTSEASLCSPIVDSHGNIFSSCAQREYAPLHNVYVGKSLTAGKKDGSPTASAALTAGYEYHPKGGTGNITGHIGGKYGTRASNLTEDPSFSPFAQVTGSLGYEGEVGDVHSYGRYLQGRRGIPVRWGAGMYAKKNVLGDKSTTVGGYANIKDFTATAGYNPKTGPEFTVGFGFPFRKKGGFKQRKCKYGCW